MCSCGKKSPIGVISWVLLIIGGINWGLVGLGGFFGANLNLVELIFGGAELAWIIYILVGIAALILLFSKKTCKVHDKDGAEKDESEAEKGAFQVSEEPADVQRPQDGPMASPEQQENKGSDEPKM